MKLKKLIAIMLFFGIPIGDGSISAFAQTPQISLTRSINERGDVQLAWNFSGFNTGFRVTHTDIYLIDGSNRQRILRFTHQLSNYLDTADRRHGNYTYQVEVVVEGVTYQSNMVTATVLDNQLVGVNYDADNGQVNLMWNTGGYTNTAIHKVQRRLLHQNPAHNFATIWQNVPASNPNANTYTDTSIMLDMDYEYRISSAQRSGTQQQFSHVVAVATPNPASTEMSLQNWQVENIIVTNLGDGLIHITFQLPTAFRNAMPRRTDINTIEYARCAGQSCVPDLENPVFVGTRANGGLYEYIDTVEEGNFYRYSLTMVTDSGMSAFRNFMPTPAEPIGIIENIMEREPSMEVNLHPTRDDTEILKRLLAPQIRGIPPAIYERIRKRQRKDGRWK